jgi:FkbM family methyltransferase
MTVTDKSSEFMRDLSGAVASRLAVQDHGNFDADRWPDGLREAAVQRQAWLCAATLQDLHANAASYAAARELLADPQSRELLVLLVAYRLLGHRHVRLPTNQPSHWECRERAAALPRSPTKFAGMFGPLERFAIEFAGQPIELACWWLNVAWTFYLRQYYLERGETVVEPRPGDVAIDAGSCFGDTALAFAASVGDKGRVLSFEIDPANLEVARFNLAANPSLAQRIRLFDHALANAEGSLYRHGSSPGACVSTQPSNDRVPVTTIDRVVEREGIKRVDFIKMDIEGAEPAALAGAVETLRRCKPRLAISIYHGIDHLLSISLWLHSLALGYRFFLDHYTIHQEETVLFATIQ